MLAGSNVCGRVRPGLAAALGLQIDGNDRLPRRFGFRELPGPPFAPGASIACNTGISLVARFFDLRFRRMTRISVGLILSM